MAGAPAAWHPWLPAADSRQHWWHPPAGQPHSAPAAKQSGVGKGPGQDKVKLAWGTSSMGWHTPQQLESYCTAGSVHLAEHWPGTWGHLGCMEGQVHAPQHTAWPGATGSSMPTLAQYGSTRKADSHMQGTLQDAHLHCCLQLRHLTQGGTLRLLKALAVHFSGLAHNRARRITSLSQVVGRSQASGCSIHARKWDGCAWARWLGPHW